MFTIAVIEEDVRYRETLLKHVHNYDSTWDIFDYHSAGDYTRRHRGSADVVVMNVVLPDASGLELAHKIVESYPETIIIYVSENDRSMRSAFGLNVLRYIEKTEPMESVVLALKEAYSFFVKREHKNVEFRTDHGIVVLPHEAVVCIVYQGRYPVLTATCGSYKLVNTSLSKIESILPRHAFCRINSGSIVNFKFINRISAKEIEVAGYREVITIPRGKYRSIYQNYRSFLDM